MIVRFILFIVLAIHGVTHTAANEPRVTINWGGSSPNGIERQELQSLMPGLPAHIQTIDCPTTTRFNFLRCVVWADLTDNTFKNLHEIDTDTELLLLFYKSFPIKYPGPDGHLRENRLAILVAEMLHQRIKNNRALRKTIDSRTVANITRLACRFAPIQEQPITFTI